MFGHLFSNYFKHCGAQLFTLGVPGEEAMPIKKYIGSEVPELTQLYVTVILFALSV